MIFNSEGAHPAAECSENKLQQQDNALQGVFHGGKFPGNVQTHDTVCHITHLLHYEMYEIHYASKQK